ncbi:BCD family MFS transporter [Roseisolibacter sp. H3M3-2]|uniref:BCD family MFS transporter n=1 Tax=Roseisolibacter sp. H3M3-2 TaxID=3031323 RepID=UPI0023DB925B|nr:BCD family MFS transporter [Roseisolibacter sp. H3M3-2]MDF1501858.1 BCD family MFS transporter [Roseisolibacter sp. H3M3-2]
MRRAWIRASTRVPARWLPFADAATEELPLGRLLRLGLFQVTVGATLTLLTGTLNRVMIVELGVPASLVGWMLALPLLVAPFRALIGHSSDTHRSVLGWRRVPYVWFGTMMSWGGLAIMPFALILLSGDTRGSRGEAIAISALAFLLVGAGMHTTQTAGLALATDLAPARVRPRVVALLYLMLLVGTLVSAAAFGAALHDFGQIRLIQVIQGSAVVTMLVNVVALWKQEPRRPMTRAEAGAGRRPRFREAWRTFAAGGPAVRLLAAVALGTFAFNLQDVLLEPYGGEVLALSVSGTTWLTALFAAGSLAAYAVAANRMERGGDPIRVAAGGALVGALGFVAVIFATPLHALDLFRAGTALIGFGEGCFAVGTLAYAMAMPSGQSGIALGAWGAVFATSEGLALALSGAVKDAVDHLAARGVLTGGMADPSVSYSVVYHAEIAFLFLALVALGPLVAARAAPRADAGPPRFGLAELPG